MFLDFYIAGQYIYYKYYYNKDKNGGTQEEDIELETFDSSAKDNLVLSSNDTKSHYPGVNEAERSLVMENKTDTPPPSVVGGLSRRSSTI